MGRADQVICHWQSIPLSAARVITRPSRKQIILTKNQLTERHSCSDPDAAFHLIADPELAFYFNEDPDPAPHQSDGNLRPHCL